MSKLENVYPYTDLLAYAEDKKICSWNKAIDLLRNDDHIPFYETRSKEICPSDGDELSSENEQLRQIIDGFCKENKISFITIIDG